VADDGVKRVDLAGNSPPRLICKTVALGGTWGADGTVLLGTSFGALRRVPADGGVPLPVTTLGRGVRTGEKAHAWPQFLPDGRHFVYLATHLPPDSGRIYVGSLDSDGRRFLLQADSPAQYAPPGYLLFVQAGTLKAAAFDHGGLRLLGQPVAIADPVGQAVGFSYASFSAGAGGVLAYRTAADPVTQPVWHDRAGRAGVRLGTPGLISNPSLSTDDRRAAYHALDARTGTHDVLVAPADGGPALRLTSDDEWDLFPIWWPDGRRIAFTTNRSGPFELYSIPSDGGDERRIGKVQTSGVPEDWSPDGRLLMFRKYHNLTKTDLWLLPAEGDQTPRLYLRTPAVEWHAQFSPDGRWVAYASDESGRFEVYLAPLSSPGERRRVSVGGGTQPRWRGDGRELFYVAADGRLMAVGVRGGAGSRVTLLDAVALFALRTGESLESWHYDVDSAGQRFLVTTPVEDDLLSTITVVLNWTAAVRR
jgi:hypothetical protein